MTIVPYFSCSTEGSLLLCIGVRHVAVAGDLRLTVLSPSVRSLALVRAMHHAVWVRTGNVWTLHTKHADTSAAVAGPILA